MNLRHRRWVRLANGPLPDPLPRVVKGCCPAYRMCFSCCSHPDAVYLNRWDWKHRPTLYHELGHWFDYQHLTGDVRHEIRLHYGWPRLPWFWPHTWDPEAKSREPNCERFASFYTRMLLHPGELKWLRRTLREVKA